ncbi:MAG: ABC transporter substrate-binding protein [Thermodesulfobacteriota bacterium]
MVRKQKPKSAVVVFWSIFFLLVFLAPAYGQDEIRLGILTSLTGALGTEGQPCYETFTWTAEEINKIGPPLGKPIKLVVSDDATEVERGIAGAKKLITTDKVIGLLGPSSSIVVAIMKFCEDSGVPLISHWSGSTRLTTIGGQYQFRTCPDDFFEGYVAAQFMKDMGWKSAGLIALNDEDTLSIANAFKKQYAKGDFKIVADVLINPDQTTYRTASTQVLNAKPDGVFFAISVDTLKIVYREMYEMGINFKTVLSANALQPSTIELLGEAIEGAYGESPANALKSPAYEIFEKMYAAHMADKTVSWFTPNAYDAMNIYALAIEAAKEASGKAISKFIREVANPPGVEVYSYEQGVAELRKGNQINYEGASGPCDFDEFGNIVGNSRIEQAQGGKWVEVKFYSGAELAKEIK